MKWFVAQVRVNTENKIKRTIENLNDERVKEVFIPINDGNLIMPGYVFILSDSWPEFPIKLKGFKVLGTAEDDKVKNLKKMSTNAVVEEKPPFRKGDSVIFIDGPFVGIKAKICQPGKKRSRISLFNSEVIMDADNSQLELAT